MKEYILNYYPLFKCIAGECQHTCCADWEMMIDSQSLASYKNEGSPFAKRLKDGINFKKSAFKSDKNGRCAFLNGDGLCEIIINLGESRLCQICRDHPRFRSFFEDRTEMGLGFCCEQASAVILSFTGKIEPLLFSDDGKAEDLSYNHKNVLAFRQRALDILQDRAVDINNRISSLLALCNAGGEKDFKKIIKAFLSLERLDKAWGSRLKRIKTDNFNQQTNGELSLYCEQFLSNGIYRHLSAAEDTMWVRAITVSLIFAWWVIKEIISNERTAGDLLSTTADVIRAFSSEVEYSQKNLDKLFGFAYKFIEI